MLEFTYWPLRLSASVPDLQNTIPVGRHLEIQISIRQSICLNRTAPYGPRTYFSVTGNDIILLYLHYTESWDIEAGRPRFRRLGTGSYQKTPGHSRLTQSRLIAVFGFWYLFPQFSGHQDTPGRSLDIPEVRCNMGYSYTGVVLVQPWQ